MYVKIIAFFPLFLHVHNKWLSVQFIGIFFSFLRSSTISVTECTTNFFTSPEMNYSYSLSALSSYFVLCPNTQNRNASFIIGWKLRGILRNGNSLCFYGFVHFAHFATNCNNCDCVYGQGKHFPNWCWWWVTTPKCRQCKRKITELTRFMKEGRSDMDIYYSVVTVWRSDVTYFFLLLKRRRQANTQ